MDSQRYDDVVSAVVNRLDPKRSAALKRNYTDSLTQLQTSNPEQLLYLTTLSRGSDHNNRLQLNLDTLVRYYFDGPATQGTAGRPNIADEDLRYSVVRCIFDLDLLINLLTLLYMCLTQVSWQGFSYICRLSTQQNPNSLSGRDIPSPGHA
jgi:hypothetical protein